MAVITPTYPKPRPADILYVLWSGLTAGDTGRPVGLAQYSDKNVSIYGTFGGNVTMEGTDDPRGNPDHADHASAVWLPITDTLDVSGISKSANAGEAILQNYAWIRPVAGASVSSVNIAMTCKKGN